MYANPGTKWACPITIPCRNYQDSYTHCNHSETVKTNGEKLHKFITVIQESNSNQSQENTKKKYTREIAAKQYKVQEYGHPTRKLEKNKGILPSNKSIDPKKRIKVLCRPN